MSISNWKRELFREAETLGLDIKISHTSSGHLRIELPNGASVFCGSTPSDWRSLRNTLVAVRTRGENSAQRIPKWSVDHFLRVRAPQRPA